MLFHTDFEIYKVRETQIPWFIRNLSSPQVVILIRAEITLIKYVIIGVYVAGISAFRDYDWLINKWHGVVWRPFTSISAHCPLPGAGIYIPYPRHYLHSKEQHTVQQWL